MSVEITGLRDLQKALRQFPKNVQKNICVGANRAAAARIAKSAKMKVSVRTGTLKRSIRVVKRKTENNAVIKHSVSAGGKVKWSTKGEKKTGDAFYAHMVEFGTSKMSAQPFMRPALEEAGGYSLKEYKAYAAKRIDKEIKKAKNG